MAAMAGQVPNVCAGPFGAFYDFYIERPWLMRLIGRAIWGIDASVLYASMEPIGRAPAGATIVDVPCGGGVAFRAISSEQDVRYLAADLCPKMLRRAGRRARARSLKQVELLTADMTELPFSDGEVDLFLSYSGLHMIDDPGKAVIGDCSLYQARWAADRDDVPLGGQQAGPSRLQSRQLPRASAAPESRKPTRLARGGRLRRTEDRPASRLCRFRRPQVKA